MNEWPTFDDDDSINHTDVKKRNGTKSSIKNVIYIPDNNYKKIAYVLSKKIEEYIFPDKFDLKLTKLFGGYSIILEGNTKKDEKIIRDCRNKLSELLGIRFENHDTYTFHITLAYILRKLKNEEIEKLIKINFRLLERFLEKFPIIRIQKPVLCTFENMYEFKST